MRASSHKIQRNKMIGYLVEAVRGAATALDTGHTSIGNKAGLSLEQWGALAAIGRTSCSLSVSQLARKLGHSRQSTHDLAIRLERAGWIRFWRNSSDRRRLHIEITADGKTILSHASARRREWLITMTYDMTDSELYALTNTLRALHNRIARARIYA
jgi:DNA-binding MarR family transcriptional regulator